MFPLPQQKTFHGNLSTMPSKRPEEKFPEKSSFEFFIFFLNFGFRARNTRIFWVKCPLDFSNLLSKCPDEPFEENNQFFFEMFIADFWSFERRIIKVLVEKPRQGFQNDNPPVQCIFLRRKVSQVTKRILSFSDFEREGFGNVAKIFHEGC